MRVELTLDPDLCARLLYDAALDNRALGQLLGVAEFKRTGLVVDAGSAHTDPAGQLVVVVDVRLPEKV